MNKNHSVDKEAARSLTLALYAKVLKFFKTLLIQDQRPLYLSNIF